MTQEITEANLIDLLNGVDAAIIGVVPMTEYVLENAPKLKVVSMHGVGVDHIDLEAAKKHGIVVTNCLGSNDHAVADLTIGLMVSIARNIPAVDRELREGGWGRYKGHELWNKSLGLIGFGHIGRAVAKRAIGFEMKILVHDPFIDSKPDELPNLKFISFDEVIRESDFLSLHTPLTDETRNMIGTDQFQAMKSNAYLINTARGELVDEQALYKALIDGHIAGAALDVYAKEPPKNNPLIKLNNVVLTPHIGAHTNEAIERMSTMAVQNALQTLQGKEPHFRVV